MADTHDRSITLRWDVRPGDLGRLLSLHGALYADEWGYDLTFEGYVAGTLGHFAAPLDPSGERLWLAEIDTQLVGCVALVRHSAVVGQLRWLLVAPAARGRGLGRRLVGEVVAFARSAGYRSVFLDTVRELEAAAALYRAAGFALVLLRRPTAFAVLAFLIAENGVAVAALSVGGGLPLVVELGAAFDVVVVIAVAAVLQRRILAVFGTTDPEIPRGARG